MPRKKKLSELKQIHGKLEVESQQNPSQYTPTMLSQIWGDEGLNKYKTLNADVYASQLTEMNSSDLRRHAVDLGIVPIENRERLTKRLISEFYKHVASYQKPGAVITQNKPTKEILDILAEAK
jgi:hypothetical protein